MRSPIVKKFCHEAALWRRLNHQNITSVLGVTIDPYQVVFDRGSDKDTTQYTLNNGVDRASLVSFIPDSLPTPPNLTGAVPSDFGCSRRSWIFTLSKRHPWETQRGESSATSATRIATDCLRKAAVLVNGDGRAMLTDFGSCSVVWDPENLPQQIVRWCAPEVLGSNGVSGTPPTYASDVFSFGMVVLEVGLTG
jgi:serine/threonine protein kinase